MIALPRFWQRRREAELDRLENAAAIAAALHERMHVQVGDNISVGGFLRNPRVTWQPVPASSITHAPHTPESSGFSTLRP